MKFNQDLFNKRNSQIEGKKQAYDDTIQGDLLKKPIIISLFEQSEDHHSNRIWLCIIISIETMVLN